MFTAVGGQSTAAKMLKSTSGWIGGGNGTEAYSFSALPAGYRNNYGIYYGGEDQGANFWSSSDFFSDQASCMLLLYLHDFASLSCNYKYDGYSVRCIKD